MKGFGALGSLVLHFGSKLALPSTMIIAYCRICRKKYAYAALNKKYVIPDKSLMKNAARNNLLYNQWKGLRFYAKGQTKIARVKCKNRKLLL